MIIVARICFLILTVYVAILVLLYVFQRQILYVPDKHKLPPPATAGAPSMKAIEVTTADGLKLAAWFAPPRGKGGKIIIMYHGNAGNISHRADKAQFYIDHGYGVYLCEYRGYGGNPGRPTEQGLYADARTAPAWLEKQGYSPAQFILYGESLGTGVAVQMALELQPRFLVLEAPFSSAVDAAAAHYAAFPVSALMKDRYDSLSKIGKVKSSLLIVHGDEDKVIPIELSRKLFDAANHPKEFSSIHEGGHVDLY
jgi:fermentation-respiration switch protein FrsA (DUF1100 family)